MVAVYLSSWYIGETKVSLVDNFRTCSGEIGCRLYREDTGQIEQCNYVVTRNTYNHENMIAFVEEHMDFFQSSLYICVDSLYYAANVCSLNFSCCDSSHDTTLDKFCGVLGEPACDTITFTKTNNLWKHMNDICS